MEISFKQALDEIGLPIVTLNIEGDGYFFLIDTGSRENHLLDYSQKHFLEHYKDSINELDISVEVRGLGGGFKGCLCQLNFSIGQIVFCETFATIPNTTVFQGISQRLDEPICGILGSRFLKDAGCMLDFEKKCLVLKNKQPKNSLDWIAKTGIRKYDIIMPEPIIDEYDIEFPFKTK